MKNRLLTIVLAFLPLMSWGQGTTDPQPYARLAEDGNNNLVLTFYYNLDKNDSDFGIGPFTSASDRGWHSSRANIKEVVFDESFASYDGLSSMNMWFYQMSGLTKVTGISNLNTANVTSLRSTFNGCSSLTSLDLSSLNTSEVKEMNFMFDGCSSLTDLKVGFSTENVTTMANMFLGCSSLTTLDLSTFNTANVKSNMDYMFSSCSALTTIYVSDLWTTENVTSGNEMFNACQSLVGGQGTTFSTSHRGLDYAHIDGGTANPGYFTEKNTAPYVNPEPYVVLTDSNTVLTFYYDDQKAERGGIAFLDGTNVYWPSSITSVTQAVFDSSFADFSPTSTANWFNGLSGLTIVTGLEYLNTEHVTSMEGMFEDCSGLTSLDISGFKTANVTNMRYVFMNCSGLTTIDLSSFNTSNVTDMNRMFLGCSGLTSLDLSGFNTDNVTDMGLFFSGCSSLTSLNVSGFNTANVTDMNGLFAGCSSLASLDVSGFNTANVTDMNRMFADCSGLTTLNLSAFNTTNVTNMSGMFSGACFNLKTIYVGSDWSTALVSSSDLMFFGCTNLVGGKGTVYNPDHIDASYAHIDGGVSNPGYFTDKNAAPYVDPEPYVVLTDSNTVLTFYYDDQKTARAGIDINSSDLGNSPSPYGTATSAVFDASFANYYPTSTAYWFQNCSALTSISGVENLKTSNVTYMSSMFEGCAGLTSLDLSGFNTSNVTYMYGMFYGCSGLTSLDVSGFNTANVTSMNALFRGCSGLASLDLSGFNTSNVTSMSRMFEYCYGLTSLDVSSFNTSNVTNMWSMFEGCSGLTSLDLSGFNTSNVTDMSDMFWGCSGLTSLDLSGFNTSNVINMGALFRGCSGLTSLDLSGFNTSNVTYMSWMFEGCSSLTSLDVSGFNTANVTDMGYVFRGCSALTSLDVSGFNTSNVTNMSWMFEGCSSLTSLDLSGFNTSNVTDMREMFMGCSGLKTIYVGNDWSTASVIESILMFSGCTNLVGGMGTVYNPDHVDASYAHIDGGTSNPGYFTLSGDGPSVPVDVTFDNHGVLTVGGTATMAEALETVGGVSAVAETVTAVVWNSTATLTNSDLQDLDNPNMLVYVPSEMQAPVNRDNVIIGNDSTGYTAKNIVLTDVESGNQNFYCPKAFVAEMITYAHDYLQQTEVGVSRGWETIALPFTVQTIMHEKQGVIAPFGNDASNKHFWLRQLMMQGLTRATVIEANMPYLIAMPNSDAYAAEFNLNGRVTFSSQNVEVPQTQMNVMEAHDANDNMMMFVPCFQAQPQGQEIYALNVGEQRDNHPEGSVFEANYREVRPFEAFTVHNGNGPAPRFVLISEMMGGATEIEDVRSKMSDGRGDNWYDMNGRKLQKEPTRKGVYLNKGRKVVVQK